MSCYRLQGPKQSDREWQETKTGRQTDISNTELGSSGPLGETEPHQQPRNSVCLLRTAHPREFSVGSSLRLQSLGLRKQRLRSLLVLALAEGQWLLVNTGTQTEKDLALPFPRARGTGVFDLVILVSWMLTNTGVHLFPTESFSICFIELLTSRNTSALP